MVTFNTTHPDYQNVERYLIKYAESRNYPWRRVQVTPIYKPLAYDISVPVVPLDWSLMNNQPFQDVSRERFYFGSLYVSNFFRQVVPGQFPVHRKLFLSVFDGFGGFDLIRLIPGSATNLSAAEHGSLEDAQPGFFQGDYLVFNDVRLTISSDVAFAGGGTFVDVSVLFHGWEAIFS